MDGGEAKEGGRARICDFFLLKTLISLLLGDQVKRNDGSDCQYLDMGVIWLLLSILPFRDLCWHVIETE